MSFTFQILRRQEESEKKDLEEVPNVELQNNPSTWNVKTPDFDDVDMIKFSTEPAETPGEGPMVKRSPEGDGNTVPL